ncbi:beta-1,3-glucosyltransferase isoform X3 [Brachyhypopomus gauderio]|uniref:beta-1,3-glucosyltransferase isoform X3 n=1 Tax=Brachyhypopomus gauderio TaxID=698409 RepID=UPI0040428B7D
MERQVPMNRLIELREVVFVIQSQKISYHAQRAEQKRGNIFHQAQTLNQGAPDVVFLHELSAYDGDWGILPALPRLAEDYCQSSLWVFFLEEETVINLARLLQVLARFGAGREWFLGRALHDDDATIIHHYAFSEEPDTFAYPDFIAGWALSCVLVKRLASYMKYEPPKSDFTIDLKHEIALYIWEEAHGPALMPVHQFCSDLHGSPSTEHCASTVNTYLPSCGSPVEREDIFVAVKTCQKFHSDRVPVVKKTWAKDAMSLEYYSDLSDPTIPTTDLGVANTEKGHCAKTFAILSRFAQGGVTRAPWLLLVDDDTLISLPRLRQLLRCYDPREAVGIVWCSAEWPSQGSCPVAAAVPVQMLQMTWCWGGVSADWAFQSYTAHSFTRPVLTTTPKSSCYARAPFLSTSTGTSTLLLSTSSGCWTPGSHFIIS